jgi:hypothetical protein
MKRKTMFMVSALVLAISLFTATAFASGSGTEGYDAFKDVIRKGGAHDEQRNNATVTGGFTIEVNGEQVKSMSGTAKYNHQDESHAYSGEFDLNVQGIERSARMYGNGETVYWEDRTHGLFYQVIHNGHSDEQEDGKHDSSWQLGKTEEAFLDLLMGDLKQQFTLVRLNNGSATITFDADRADLPLPLQMMAGVAFNKGVNEENLADEDKEWSFTKDIPFFQGVDGAFSFQQNLPKLTDDIAIDRMWVQMTVDAESQVTALSVEWFLSGKDAEGVAHNIRVAGTAEMIDINATVPDAFDPAGKTIELIEVPDHDYNRD